MSDEIFLTDATGIDMFVMTPVEPADSDPNYIKHVVCEGARFHVIGYSTTGRFCSEARCIINKWRDENMLEIMTENMKETLNMWVDYESGKLPEPKAKGLLQFSKELFGHEK